MDKNPLFDDEAVDTTVDDSTSHTEMLIPQHKSRVKRSETGQRYRWLMCVGVFSFLIIALVALIMLSVITYSVFKLATEPRACQQIPTEELIKTIVQQQLEARNFSTNIQPVRENSESQIKNLLEEFKQNLTQLQTELLELQKLRNEWKAFETEFRENLAGSEKNFSLEIQSQIEMFNSSIQQKFNAIIEQINHLGIVNNTVPPRSKILCPDPGAPVDGSVVVSRTDGAISVGSTATYSCDSGFVLVGQTVRTCVDINGGTVGGWTGIMPSCQGPTDCSTPPAPGNGSVVVQSMSSYYGVSLTATYSCDTGFSLVGPSVRTCNSQYHWSGTQPSCQIILCPELSAPDDGSIVLSSGELGVGSTANYSCDTGFRLVGPLVRTCESPSTGVVGTWSGVEPFCAIPSPPEIDCRNQICRYSQLVCPEQDNCTVHCYDSRDKPCYSTDVYCPNRLGDCTINCSDSYACNQFSATCTQGDCAFNCEASNSCSNFRLECSGENCTVICQSQDSCKKTSIVTTSQNFVMKCNDSRSCRYLDIKGLQGSLDLYCYDYSCESSSVICPNECLISCHGESSYYSSYRGCRHSTFSCPTGGKCTFSFIDHGLNSRYYQSYYLTVNGSRNSSSVIVCSGSYVCSSSTFNCPSESGYCNIQCDAGRYACSQLTVTCGPNEDCLDCSGSLSCQYAAVTFPSQGTINCTGSSSCQRSSITFSTGGAVDCTGNYSCQYASVNCSSDASCTIHCDGIRSCDGATITCPTGDYTCNVLCTHPFSCSSLRIYNVENLFFQCCGESACSGANVPPSTIECL